jgi:trehalose 6-phosphate phosphatase
LIELAARPQDVMVDAELLELLRDLYRATGGALAMITGRTLADLDSLLDPLHLPAAGQHGIECRQADGHVFVVAASAAARDSVRVEVAECVRQHVGLQLEDKGFAFAVHYRNAPLVPVEPLREQLAAIAAQTGGEYELLEGAKVIELKPVGSNKGLAIEYFLSLSPFCGRRPIFLGDDVTDLCALETVTRAGGVAVAAGPRVRAEWQLPGPATVRAWLQSLLPEWIEA